MTPPIENLPTWLVDWSLVTIIDNTLPPRDPNDDDMKTTRTTRGTTRGTTRTTSPRSSENPTRTNSAAPAAAFAA
jgi:hypothetical protein